MTTRWSAASWRPRGAAGSPSTCSGSARTSAARGWAADLLRRIEERARAERDCVGVRLDTWGFQAKPFYEKQGYEVFGVLEDHPPGETEYLLAKRLDRPGSRLS